MVDAGPTARDVIGIGACILTATIVVLTDEPIGTLRVIGVATVPRNAGAFTSHVIVTYTARGRPFPTVGIRVEHTFEAVISLFRLAAISRLASVAAIFEAGHTALAF